MKTFITAFARTCVLVLLTLGVFVRNDVRAQPLHAPDAWTQQAKVTATDLDTYGWFGISAALDGDTLVIGAHGARVDGKAQQGAAYVFVKPPGGWTDATQSAKLVASGAGSGENAGQSVAISGDTIVIGAQNADGWKGVAYVFVKPVGGWTGTVNQVARLTASDAVVESGFGVSVGISGDTTVVGSYWQDVNGNDKQGAAYVFNKPLGGWSDMTESAKLTASNGTANDWFGQSVGISGDTILSGAQRHDVSGRPDQGAAYIFVKPTGGWAGNLNESANLVVSDGDTSDMFGFPVAMSGDTAAVIAQEAEGRGNGYVFVKPAAGWSGNVTETAKLHSTDAGVNELFGDSVATDGNTVVIGSPWYGNGAAFVFKKPGGGWANMTETAKLLAADAGVIDNFGESVAVDGDTTAVGAYWDTINGKVAWGSAYVFGYSGPPAPNTPTLKKPANGATVTTKRPKLDWTDATNATAYQVELREKKKTGKLIANPTVAVSNYKTPKLKNLKYWWRVRASNETGYSAWTGWRSFVVNVP
ncbi:MAG: hypothetical protein HY741_10955 [Chloroflexi bacterium]|nr:hypothetical protein [Chloroflexota bacterium]